MAKAKKKAEAPVNIVDTAKVPAAEPVGRTHNSPEEKKK